MKGVIDRFEGKTAVFLSDDGALYDLPPELLYTGIKQHDVVDFTDGVLTFLPEETEKRKEDISALFNRLRRKK